MTESEIEGRLADAGYEVEVIDRPHSPIAAYVAVAKGHGHETEAWGDSRADALKALLVAVASH